MISVSTPSNLLFADFAPVSVKDSRFGAAGDGGTDDTAALQAAFDHCFGSSDAPHGTANVRQNKILYIPPGHYKTTAPLANKYLHGARVTGAGRFVAQIENVTPGSSVLTTNGCGYSRFEGMRLTAASGGKSFDLDWDGSAGGPALQSNTFRRHVLRWRFDRHRDRTFRLHGLGEPVSQLLLAVMLDRRATHVERQCATTDCHRRKFSNLRDGNFRRDRVGSDRSRGRVSAVVAIGHLYRLFTEQRDGCGWLPQ
jgi:pectate lyase-like protein